MTVNVLGTRRDFLVCVRAEGVLHHFEVGVEMARALLAGKRCEEVGVAECRDEVVTEREISRVDSPQGLAADETRHEIVNHVGRECTREPRLGVAFRAVVEHRASRLDCCGCVSQVVGEHLLSVGSTVVGEVPHRFAHHCAGGLDDRRSCLQVGSREGSCAGHGTKRYP